MSAKKDIMNEIERRIARKKEVVRKAIAKSSIEAFVSAFIDNITEINEIAGSDAGTWGALYPAAQQALIVQLQNIDKFCSIDVSWVHKDGEAPQVNGVLIKWSKNYQIINSVEPELFVDSLSLIFKD